MQIFMVSKFPLEFDTFLPTFHWVIRSLSIIYSYW